MATEPTPNDGDSVLRELTFGAPQAREGRPIHRPDGIGAYRFAVVSALRAVQLLRGCTPRVSQGVHRATVVAQLEVAAGQIVEVGAGGTPRVETVSE